jgi:hypothetical protein
MTPVFFVTLMACQLQLNYSEGSEWKASAWRRGALGNPVSIGDLDSDGYSDFAIQVGGLASAVDLVSGIDGHVIKRLWADPSHLSRMAFGTYIRTSTANGVANSRLVVSDPGAPGKGTVGGAVEIYELPSYLHVGTINGDDYSDFGFWIESDRDLNGDGVDEIAVASPLAIVSDGSSSGDARVFDGATFQQLFRFEGTGGEHLTGPLSFLDDMDGDGVPDLLIASPWYGPKGRGRLVLVSGNTGQSLWEIQGDKPMSALGQYAGRLGDIDGDGRAEFAVVTNYSRKFRVYGGFPPTILYELDYAIDLKCLVSAICGVGDHDGDGIPDIVVAGRHPSGHMPMRMLLLSGRDGSTVQTIESPPRYANDEFGHSIVRSDDFTGDGTEDLLVFEQSQTSTASHVMQFGTQSLFLDRPKSDNGQPGPAASLRISAPNRPGMLYSILLSTEDAPRISIGNRFIPLGQSPLLTYTLLNPVLGHLDASGEAIVDVNPIVPALPPGFDLYAAWISPDSTAPNNLRAISNRVQIPLR